MPSATPSILRVLLAVARDFHLALVEDAAESLGSTIGGRHTGTFGLMGTLSFNGNKTITTGGGGAILTNDAELAKRAKHLTTTAKVPHRWEYRHDEVGYNYRLPNINAALGCAQLEQLAGFPAGQAAAVRALRGRIRRRCRSAHRSANRTAAAATTGCRRCCWIDIGRASSATRFSPRPTMPDS